MYDVVVVGAGPSGSRLAARAAAAGLRTLVLEEHGDIGAPVHCTGIVGEDMLRRYDLPPELIVGEVHPFRVVSPGQRTYALPGVRAWLLHRRELDVHLARQAAGAGAELALGERVESVHACGHHVEVRSTGGVWKARVVVLATGAMTNLPYTAGLLPPPRFYRTAQVQAQVAGLEGVELYLGARMAPGSFAYAVAACGGSARVGVIARSTPALGLRRLLDDLGAAGRLDAVGEPPKGRRIPMGFSPRSVHGRILAVGDAAGQAKTTTGGGIYYGMSCADLLADALQEARVAGDFRTDRLARYDRAWKDGFREELRAGVRVRRLFEQVRDDELEELAVLLERPEVQRVIAEQGDFDRHRALLVGLTNLPAVRAAALGLARRRLPGAPLVRTLAAAVGRTIHPQRELAI